MPQSRQFPPIEKRRIDLLCFSCRQKINTVGSCWVEWRWQGSGAGSIALDFVTVHTFHTSPIGGCRTDRTAGSSLLAFVDPATPQVPTNYKDQLRGAGMLPLRTRADKAMFILFDGLERRFTAENAGTNKSHITHGPSVSMRFAVLKRDGYRCQICGRNPKEDGVKLQVDHITPFAKGGITALHNLQTLCHECNYGKGINGM